jgi:hypothetical protein
MNNPAGQFTNAYLAWQEQKRFKDLEAEAKKLDKTAAPEYELNPALAKAYEQTQSIYSGAQARANEGFTGAQEDAFVNALNTAGNVMTRNAMETGGGQLGQFAGSLNNANRLNALADFAEKDAILQQQKKQYADSTYGMVMQAGNTLQGQQNIIQQQRIQRRNMLEQALGRAMSDTRMRRDARIDASAAYMDNEITGAQNAALQLTGAGAMSQPQRPTNPASYTPQPTYGGQEVVPGYNDYSTFTG